MVLTNIEIVMRKPAPLEDIINGFEVIKDLGFYKNHTRFAILKCKVCDKNFESHVSRAKTRKSCGCIPAYGVPLDKIINGFKVIEDLGLDSNTKFRSAIVECKVCYRHYSTPIYNLKHRKSCGCIIKGTKVSKYTNSHRDILHTLRRMKARCYNKKNGDYYNYGARGITICDQWKNSQDSFVEWALSNGWVKGLSIDRIDNNKGYFPENCRWIPMHEQARNKRTNIMSMDLANELRKDYQSGIIENSILSKKYKISPTMIKRILENKSWRDDSASN